MKEGLQALGLGCGIVAFFFFFGPDMSYESRWLQSLFILGGFCSAVLGVLCLVQAFARLLRRKRV